MSKTFMRVTFAIMTTIYMLTHFLPHARAQTLASDPVIVKVLDAPDN